MKRRILLLLCLVGGMAALRADVTVKDVTVKPRWPWNGLVDITYSIVCKEKDDDNNFKDVYLDFTALDGDRNQTIPMKSLTGQGAKDPVKDGGPYTVTWDASKDAPTLNSSDLKVQIHAIAISTYIVVNLNTGKVRYKSQAPDLSDDTCRTTELWLRCILPGTFIMGTPSDEIGRSKKPDYVYDFAQHEVTLTKVFYIGIFECTQMQWQLIMGDNPSYSTRLGDCRPVEAVSYSMIRGSSSTGGGGWPNYGHAVDASSFMGKLRDKTNMTFDLPTDAQWEYACRAGTTTALNSGKNLTTLESWKSDDAMNEVGRNRFNTNDGKGGYIEHTKVGSYLPNRWGLYDMHGNVWEWCLDWFIKDPKSTNAVVDPVGPLSATSVHNDRVVRGGAWTEEPHVCRSGYRSGKSYWCTYGNYDERWGFRIVCLPLE